MTPNDHEQTSGAAGGDSAVERILDHNRLQLSAFLDGELRADEARFLLRRLEHDAELRGCWERWQFSGAVLRGQVGRCVADGFSVRVAEAVAAQGQAAHRGAGGARWLRWGGGAAVAASVAMVALLLVRQAPGLRPEPIRPASVAATRPTPVPAPATTPAPAAPDHAAQVAAAFAVANAPRRLAARRPRGQEPRAALRPAMRSAGQAPAVVAVAAAPFANAAAPADPFLGRRLRLANRPWPRALLPGSVNGGAFEVDYADRGGNAFVPGPRLFPSMPQPAPATDATGADGPPPQ